MDFERASLIEYDPFDHQFMSVQGETKRYKDARDISKVAEDWKQTDSPLKFFMDGSRRTYKIADLAIGTQVFPIIAGQVGVATCGRVERRIKPCGDPILHIVMAFPDKMDADGKGDKQHTAFCNDLLKKLNAQQNRVKIDRLLWYKTPQNENYEDKGVARIQDYMIEKEKEMVKILVEKKLLNYESFLIKDGSLEYSRIPDQNNPFAYNRIRNNYKYVIGVSKSFNPELAKLENNRSAARMIAKLEPFERTPAAMYSTDRVEGKFSVWYVRLRKARRSRGPFDGIVKVEKILISSDETENGLESDEVDRISAWLINERNPVCYGKDDRWANHLYPVYLTESFIKSKYIGANRFLNLF